MRVLRGSIIIVSVFIIFIEIMGLSVIVNADDYAYGITRKCIDENYMKDFELFEQACNSGDIEGCYYLGLLYDVNRNYSMAANLYRKVCDGGYAKGCSCLGFLFYDGLGVKQDYFTAARLFKRACNNGDDEGCNVIGIFYENGIGVGQNKIKAYQYWIRAARVGNVNAQHNLDILCKQSPWACR